MKDPVDNLIAEALDRHAPEQPPVALSPALVRAWRQGQLSPMLQDAVDRAMLDPQARSAHAEASGEAASSGGPAATDGLERRWFAAAGRRFIGNRYGLALVAAAAVLVLSLAWPSPPNSIAWVEYEVAQVQGGQKALRGARSAPARPMLLPGQSIELRLRPAADPGQSIAIEPVWTASKNAAQAAGAGVQIERVGKYGFRVSVDPNAARRPFGPHSLRLRLRAEESSKVRQELVVEFDYAPGPEDAR